MMLYAHGVGEIAISISGCPSRRGTGLMHTIRNVGDGEPGAARRPRPARSIGVRGPFGHGWDLDAAGARPDRRRRRRRTGAAAPGGARRARGARSVPARRAPRRRARSVEISCTRPSCRPGSADGDLDVVLTDRPAGLGMGGAVGFVTDAMHRVDFDPDHTTALLCGPEPMMRFGARALLDRGVAPERHPRLAGTQHAVRDRLVRALPARRRCCCAATDPSSIYALAEPLMSRTGAVMMCRRPRWPCGSSRPATAASSPCSTARTNCSRSPEQVQIAHFLEASGTVVAGPYDVSLVEGSITHRRRRERIQRGARAVAGAGHDRRVRHRGRHPGAAQLRRRRGVPSPPSTRAPSTSTPSPRRPPIAAHVPVDFELRGCPIDRRQLLEVHLGVPRRPQAGHPDHQRLHRVQAARR